jgi:hypothetical protein
MDAHLHGWRSMAPAIRRSESRINVVDANMDGTFMGGGHASWKLLGKYLIQLTKLNVGKILALDCM